MKWSDQVTEHFGGPLYIVELDFFVFFLVFLDVVEWRGEIGV